MKTKRPRLLSDGQRLKSGRFRVERLLAEGGFGQIYSARDDDNYGNLVAVKAEEVGAALPLLHVELRVYRALDDWAGPQTHFLKHLGSGEEAGANYLILQLAGHSLSHLRRSLGASEAALSPATSLRLGMQMLAGLRDLHAAGWLHRDVKPSNFCVGHTLAKRVFVLDFGLARQFKDRNGEHKAPRPDCGFRGTVRYASVHIHQGLDLGRRDDLWSLVFILAEQMLGQLPWRRLTDKAAVLGLKEAWAPDAALPSSFHGLLDHLRSLSFADEPHYDSLADAFAADLDALGVRHDDPFDWEPNATATDLLSSPAPLPVPS